MLTTLSVVALGAATVLPLNSAQAATAPAGSAASCHTDWGSQPKQIPWQYSVLTDVRAGRHDCFDRLVLDGASMLWVRYVDQVVSDGSGEVVPVRGGARLEIVTNGSVPAESEPWEAGYVPDDPTELVDVSGFQTFRQVAHAGEFEGNLTLGLGVRARLPFRTFVLTSPGQQPRVVIDVAHHW